MEGIQILNAGVPGNSSSEILARLDKIIAEKPDMVCLMVGTNDTLNSLKSVCLCEYEKNVCEIIERLHEMSVSVILITIPPCIDEFLIERHGKDFFSEFYPTQKVDMTNTVLKKIAGNKNLQLIDLNKAIKDSGRIGTGKQSLLRNEANCGENDGVHLTPDGYRLMAEMVYKSIKNIISNQCKIICLGDSITYGVHVEGAGSNTGECYPGQLAKLL